MMYKKQDNGETNGLLLGYAVSNEGTFIQDYKLNRPGQIELTVDIVDGLQGIYDGAFLQLFDGSINAPCQITLWKDGETPLTVTQYGVMNSYNPQGTLNYGQEVDYQTEAVIYDTLYDIVYKNYMQLFLNPTSRIHNYNIRLTSVDLYNLYLYKTLQIGDKFFTINKYEYNSQTQMANFELIRFLRDYTTQNVSIPTDNISPVICELGVVPNGPPTTTDLFENPNVTTTSVELSWVESTSETSTICGYNIYQDNKLVHTTTGSGTTYTVTGLTPDTSYFFNVQAIDCDGVMSDLSYRLLVSTLPIPGPVFDEPITLVSATTDSLIISWLPAITEGPDVLYYEIYVNNVLYGSRFVTSDLEMIIEGLTPCTTYDIFILAHEAVKNCDCGDFGESLTYQLSTIGCINTNFELSLNPTSGVQYDYQFNGLTGDIDWGDGNIITYTNATFASHVYATSGIYTMSIDGTASAFSPLTGAEKQIIVDVLNWGNIGATSLNLGFTNIPAVLTATDSPAFITNFTASLMFNQTLFNDPRAIGWDTGNIINMNRMFSDGSTFNQDISGWDTGNVTTMFAMFSDNAVFNQDISAWDVSNVAYMNQMFLRGNLSVTNYNLLLEGWSSQTLTPNVTFYTESQYNSAYQSYRDIMTGAPNFWLITDGGSI